MVGCSISRRGEIGGYGRKYLKRRRSFRRRGLRPKSFSSHRRCGLIRSFRSQRHFYRVIAKDARKFGVFRVRTGETAGLMQLTAENLACVRGGRDVFRGLSFAVKSGEALMVTGRNGAGKSSLLRMIAGLLRIASGKPALTVAENLQFWAEFLGPSSGDVAPALAAVELTALADLPAAYLSAGQQRRLSIARLVAVPRAIWLLDEPTAALDAASQTRLADLMRRHLASGGMIVAAAHGAIGLERAREVKLGTAA